MSFTTLGSTAEQQQEYGTRGEGDKLQVPIANDATPPSSSFSSFSFPHWLLPLVPEVSPLTWTIINNTLAVSGCLLIAECIHANTYGTSRAERPFAEAYYLIWEFATCLFWTLETGLSASYQHIVLHEKNLHWYTKLELVIALYFLITTFIMLWQWDLRKYETSNVWEITLDTSFYVYMSIRSCQRMGKAEPSSSSSESLNVAISLRNLETLGEDDEESSSSYRRMVDSNEDDGISNGGILV